MPRTKPPKNAIKKKPDIHDPFNWGGTIFNKGGHIINPPDRCPWRRIADDGGIWTDLACCQSLCTDRCKRYLKWKRMSPVMRVRDLRRHGVKYPIHPDDPEHPDYKERQEGIRKEKEKRKRNNRKKE